MRYTYFPGCLLQTTASECDASGRAVIRELGDELRELEGWNCCGNYAAESVSSLLSIALPARNLALAEQAGGELVTACSSCFANLSQARRSLQQNDEMRGKADLILAEVGLHYSGGVRVRHLLEVMLKDKGLEAIARRTRRKLVGLKVAPYYGCQIAQPSFEFDDPEAPASLDRLIVALGAQVIPYALKTRCCGRMLPVTNKSVGLKLIADLLLAAQGADCILTLCPFCQFNLDAYQAQLSRRLGVELNLPVLHFTQLVGLAFDLPEGELQLSHNIVPADGLLV